MGGIKGEAGLVPCDPVQANKAPVLLLKFY